MVLQLMVYAKIIYLLMVVISGALCTVEDYVIMSQCAHNKAIYLAAEGTVSVTDISQTQNITIVGRPDFVNNNFKIALYAKETQRYLCFNDHWKLVGMKELQDTCYFNEAIVHGYFVFRSVVNLQRRIGFTQRGRAVGPKKTVNDACYMFTKIPTDEFFLQRTHFSLSKTKSATTKIPNIEYTQTSSFVHVGRGSGVGRIKENRFKIQHHLANDSVVHNHRNSGRGIASTTGSDYGSGSGNGSGTTNRKFRKQRNGNKMRQQQQKPEMQKNLRDHNYDINNPKNSTYLKSSKQNLVLSHHNINANTNRKHFEIISSHSDHEPQNHQVRHHHNDPNKIAKRQKHDQKSKIHQHVRPSPTSSTLAVVTTTISTARKTKALAPSVASNAVKTINSTIPHYTLTSSYTEISSSVAVPRMSTMVIFDNYDTVTSKAIVAKRKGRRRRLKKLKKTGSHTKIEMVEECASLAAEENATSPVDLSWITTDFTISAITPTSPSLPSWGTWYPFLAAESTSKDSNYLLASSPAADSTLSATTSDTKKKLATAHSKNILSSQTLIPLPTPVFSTNLRENITNDILSLSESTDLGMTTTNTSNYPQTDFWTSSINDNKDETMVTIGFEREEFTTDATPKLENIESEANDDKGVFLENTNSFGTSNNSENSAVHVTTTIGGDHIFRSSTVYDTTNIGFTEPELYSATDYYEISEPLATTIRTKCASNGNKLFETKTMKTAVTVANNLEHKTSELNPKYSKISPAHKEIISRSLNTIPTNYEKNALYVETTTRPKMLAASTSLQSLVKPANENSTSRTTFISNALSTKSPLHTPFTTRKLLRKSTQRLLAIPFHQLTYVRNKAGHNEIDSIDHISIYPDWFHSDNDEPFVIPSTSRLTMISGYLPTSASVTLPESIRIAKIKINRERKRILQLRNVANYS